MDGLEKISSSTFFRFEPSQSRCHRNRLLIFFSKVDATRGSILTLSFGAWRKRKIGFMSRLERIPIFVEEAVGLEEFRAVYDVVKCVCFRRSGRKVADSERIGRKRNRQEETKKPFLSSVNHKEVLNLIHQTYESASPRDKKSWNVENEGNGKLASSMSPSKFLSSDLNPRFTSSTKENDKNSDKGKANSDGYCSFILQDDSDQAVSSFTDRVESLLTKDYIETPNALGENMLPHSMLFNCADNKSFDGCKGTTETRGQSNTPLLTIAPHYWIFVGRNHHSKNGLSGRREHTDSIEHDGTFHHQLLGGKLWKLRPTLELREICDQQHDMSLFDSYQVLVKEGDVFVINTRLWWHQTEIPTGWSVSYARDLYLGCAKPNLESEPIKGECVGNKEVSWASGFIPRGTTLVVDDVEDCFTTNDGDDVSSHYDHLVPPTIRRTNLQSVANCKLVLLPTEQGRAMKENNSEKNATSETERRKPRKEVALEMTRDIQEGEEFVMLLEEKDI